MNLLRADSIFIRLSQVIILQLGRCLFADRDFWCMPDFLLVAEAIGEADSNRKKPYEDALQSASIPRSCIYVFRDSIARLLAPHSRCNIISEHTADAASLAITSLLNSQLLHLKKPTQIAYKHPTKDSTLRRFPKQTARLRCERFHGKKVLSSKYATMLTLSSSKKS